VEENFLSLLSIQIHRAEFSSGWEKRKDLAVRTILSDNSPRQKT